MSLWHRIFGSPEQQTKKISEKPTGDEPTEHEGKGEAARSEEPPVYRDEVVEKTSAVADVAFEEPVARQDAGEPGSEEEGQPRRRRPRRRRRGRGGRKSDEASDREKPAPRGGDRSAESEQKAGPPRHAAPDDLDLDDEDDDDLNDNFLDEDESDEDGDGDTGEERSSSGRVIPPSHRNMPTWEEAIGVIVETNLQTRSERKRSPRPSSQGGSSRGGRSRGGRRKKSP
jgi:ribonuclease E